MICQITTSGFYKEYCKKHGCWMYPCSQLLEAHRKTIGEVIHIKERG